jgi:hypothetical protein
MALRLEQLQKAKRLGNGTVIARCPACAAAGQDHQGDHLVIYPDGRFGCVIFPGPDGQQHRKEIWRLAGEKKERSRPPLTVRFQVRTK